MPYITLADLLTRDSERDIINVTDPDGLAIDTSKVDQAIASAQAEVDSYIGGRLRMPLLDSEVTATLKHYTLIVARFYLYALNKTEAVISEYERAVQWLRDVAAGRASTGVVQAVEPDDVVQGATIVAPVAKPMFGADFEKLYNVPFGPNGSGAFPGGRGF